MFEKQILEDEDLDKSLTKNPNAFIFICTTLLVDELYLPDYFDGYLFCSKKSI